MPVSQTWVGAMVKFADSLGEHDGQLRWKLEKGNGPLEYLLLKGRAGLDEMAVP